MEKQPRKTRGFSEVFPAITEVLDGFPVFSCKDEAIGLLAGNARWITEGGAREGKTGAPCTIG
jgi:hypothetical protein